MPPLHIHFDQIETFKVLQGQMAVAVGYDQRDIILTPDNTPFDVPPMVPHVPYPCASKGKDTVFIVRAHPGGVGEPLDDSFFEDLFKHLDDCWNDGNKLPNLVKMMTAQYVIWLTGCSSVANNVFTDTRLGPLWSCCRPGPFLDRSDGGYPTYSKQQCRKWARFLGTD